MAHPCLGVVQPEIKDRKVIGGGPAGYIMGGPAGYMHGPAGYMVAHEILVSAQGPLVLGLRVWGQGLTIIRKMIEMIKRDKSKIDDQ